MLYLVASIDFGARGLYTLLFAVVLARCTAQYGKER